MSEAAIHTEAVPKKKDGGSRRSRLIVIAAAVAVVLAGAYYLRGAGTGGVAQGTTFSAKKGDLSITVTEGGAVQALESQEIISEIKGNQGVKILSLVEEGYLVTPEDVEKKKVLVELDSADLKNRVINEQMTFQSAESGFVEKKAQYEIQISQNETTISTAALTAKFALMDFEKYLGKKAVASITERLNLDAAAAKLAELKKQGGFKPEIDKPAVALGVAPQPAASAAGAPAAPGAPREWQGGGGGGRNGDNNGGEQRRRRQGGNNDTGGTTPQAAGPGGAQGVPGTPGGQPVTDGPARGAIAGPPGGAPGAGPGGPGGGQRGQGGGQGGGPGGGPGGGGGQRMDPERFKAMIEANGGQIPEAMAARMRERGMDPDAIVKQMGITVKPGDGATAVAPTVPAAPTAPVVSKAVFVRDEAYLAKRKAIDFASYADPEKLEDGEAKQQLRAFEDKITVANEDFRLSTNTLDGQRRLAEKKFITQNDLDLEVVKMNKAKITQQSSETDRNLYVEYTFVKTAEKLLSDYEEALMSLERTMQEASAKLALAASALTTAEQKFTLENNQLNDLQDQLAKCVIRAQRPGLVVFGSSTDSNPFRRSTEDPIQEGTTVRERQKIITIPDMTKMGVKVSIHESAVQRIAPGQKVRIRVDAFPSRPLEGTVERVAVLADSANMFMNPDLKVYPTTLRIDGVYDWLRPGMSAQTEILINTLKDVIYVPIQAVTYSGKDQVVFVSKSGQISKRVVTVGGFTEDYIEIKTGLSEGEEVLLLAPNAGKQDKLQKGDKKTGKEAGDAAPAQAPATAPAPKPARKAA